MDTTAAADLQGVIERTAWLADYGHGQDQRWLGSLITRSTVLEHEGDGDEICPAGLSALLLRLRRELTTHHAREQMLVFPMMRSGGRADIQYSVCRMIDEHHLILTRLDELAARVAHHRPAGDRKDAWPPWKLAFEAMERQLRARLSEEEQEIFLRFF